MLLLANITILNFWSSKLFPPEIRIIPLDRSATIIVLGLSVGYRYMECEGSTVTEPEDMVEAEVKDAIEITSGGVMTYIKIRVRGRAKRAHKWELKAKE